MYHNQTEICDLCVCVFWNIVLRCHCKFQIMSAQMFSCTVLVTEIPRLKNMNANKFPKYMNKKTFSQVFHNLQTNRLFPTVACCTEHPVEQPAS